MKTFFTIRSLWLLWLVGLSVFIGIGLYPVSNTITRVSEVVLFFAVGLGLISLTWRRRKIRYTMLIITALGVVFLALPGRSRPDTASLRAGYVAGLRRYEGVTYHWGGESSRGIDCSGLIRCGLTDSLFLQGIQTFDSARVRQAIGLWWRDSGARDLGNGKGLTTRLFDTPSLNTLDHSRLLPGDLAVTSSGDHIMAYLGDNLWIEADPSLGRVIILSAPSQESYWLQCPMKIVRWNILGP